MRNGAFHDQRNVSVSRRLQVVQFDGDAFDPGGHRGDGDIVVVRIGRRRDTRNSQRLGDRFERDRSVRRYYVREGDVSGPLGGGSFGRKGESKVGNGDIAGRRGNVREFGDGRIFERDSIRGGRDQDVGGQESSGSRRG